MNCYPSLIKHSSSCSRVIVPFCPSGLVLGPYDFTFLLILQLSCILHMVPFWESRTKLRVMQIVETDGINMIITKIIAKLELSLDVTIYWTRDKSVIILPSYEWGGTSNRFKQPVVSRQATKCLRSKGVFGRHTPTGNEASSVLICPDARKFELS